MKENIPRMIEEGYSTRTMAKELECSPTYVSNWIIGTYKKPITQIRREKNPNGNLTKLQVKMKENIPRMIQEGYSIVAMAKELGCGYTYVSNWIVKTYGKPIIQIRHENNIRIKIH